MSEIKFINLNARGTIITVPKEIILKSPIIETWYKNYKNGDSYYLNFDANTVNKLIDYLSYNSTNDLSSIKSIADFLLIELPKEDKKEINILKTVKNVFSCNSCVVTKCDIKIVYEVHCAYNNKILKIFVQISLQYDVTKDHFKSSRYYEYAIIIDLYVYDNYDWKKIASISNDEPNDIVRYIFKNNSHDANSLSGECCKYINESIINEFHYLIH